MIHDAWVDESRHVVCRVVSGGVVYRRKGGREVGWLPAAGWGRKRGEWFETKTHTTAVLSVLEKLALGARFLNF